MDKTEYKKKESRLIKQIEDFIKRNNLLIKLFYSDYSYCCDTVCFAIITSDYKDMDNMEENNGIMGFIKTYVHADQETYNPIDFKTKKDMKEYYSWDMEHYDADIDVDSKSYSFREVLDLAERAIYGDLYLTFWEILEEFYNDLSLSKYEYLSDEKAERVTKKYLKNIINIVSNNLDKFEKYTDRYYMYKLPGRYTELYYDSGNNIMIFHGYIQPLTKYGDRFRFSDWVEIGIKNVYLDLEDNGLRDTDDWFKKIRFVLEDDDLKDLEYKKYWEEK